MNKQISTSLIILVTLCADIEMFAAPQNFPLEKMQDSTFMNKRLKGVNKQIKDSMPIDKPFILETYILPDSLKYKRLITWKHNPYLNSIEMLSPDTTYNENFFDLPFYKKDIGATYLGVSGSAMQSINYFKREEYPLFKSFEPWLPYSYTSDNLPFYNSKTPITELKYTGTLLASRQTEESNVKFLHSQNLNPNWAFQLMYQRYGAKGILLNEATDNRTLALSSNYLGNRYVMHFGYINQIVKRTENGGIVNDSSILETKIDAQAVEITLNDASNTLRRNTLFLTHSYGLPIRFKKDSIAEGEGTITYFGHSMEFNVNRRVYEDYIYDGDEIGSNFYNNNFFIDARESHDSTRVSSFENKLFMRLQPWKRDAVISKLDAGIGLQLINVYSLNSSLDTASYNKKYKETYAYSSISGVYRKYFRWSAFGKYNLTGYYSGDFQLSGNLGFSLYPFKDGIHLFASAKLSESTPSWYENSYYSNHYNWSNTFSKTTKAQISSSLDIPRYNFNFEVGYALLTNPIYYNIQAVPEQHNGSMSILSANLKKNFTLWMLHFNNRILFQYSSSQEVVPLPKLGVNLRYFIEFDLVKNVLRGQFGADIYYNTKYFVNAYNPALSVFHTQQYRDIGNHPYFDFFANLQWKRASIFVKYVNGLERWPDADYFSALHYIKPQTSIKFGIHWPFYVK